MRNKNNKNNEASQLSLNTHIKEDILILQLMGMFSMGAVLNQKQPKMSYWELLPCAAGLGTITFGLIGDIYNAYDIAKDDWVESMQVFSAIFCSAFTLYKGYRLWLCREELHNLLKLCYHHWNYQVSCNKIHKNSIKTIINTGRLRNCYAASVSLCMTSYGIAPVIEWSKWHFTGSNESFDFGVFAYPAQYPFTVESSVPYLLWIGWENVGLYFYCLWWISTDTLFAQFTTHLAIHFKVLADEVQSMNSDLKLISGSTKVRFATRLENIVRQHLKLRKFVILVEEWYSPVIFLVVLLDAINLCSCLYCLQYYLNQGNYKYVEKAVFMGFTICVQILVYCVCAQHLNDAVCNVRQAVYKSEWIDMNCNEKRLIWLLMEQTEREYIYTSYGFIQLSMPQVTTIFSAAMRYFTLLRSVS